MSEKKQKTQCDFLIEELGKVCLGEIKEVFLEYYDKIHAISEIQVMKEKNEHAREIFEREQKKFANDKEGWERYVDIHGKWEQFRIENKISKIEEDHKKPLSQIEKKKKELISIIKRQKCEVDITLDQKDIEKINEKDQLLSTVGEKCLLVHLIDEIPLLKKDENKILVVDQLKTSMSIFTNKFMPEIRGRLYNIDDVIDKAQKMAKKEAISMPEENGIVVDIINYSKKDRLRVLKKSLKEQKEAKIMPKFKKEKSKPLIRDSLERQALSVLSDTIKYKYLRQKIKKELNMDIMSIHEKDVSVKKKPDEYESDFDQNLREKEKAWLNSDEYRKFYDDEIKKSGLKQSTIIAVTEKDEEAYQKMLEKEKKKLLTKTIITEDEDDEEEEPKKTKEFYPFRIITSEEIKKSNNVVYVFGDNLTQSGMGNQAKIARQFVPSGKAIGIPTKRKHTKTDDAYFSDRSDEIRAIQEVFNEIEKQCDHGKQVIFLPMIGEGSAELQEHSPRIYQMIRNFIAKMEKSKRCKVEEFEEEIDVIKEPKEKKEKKPSNIRWDKIIEL